jgi:hypothetical protein
MGNRMEIQVGHFSCRPTFEHRLGKQGNWNTLVNIMISIRDDHGSAMITIEEENISDEHGNYSQIWHSDKALLEFVTKSVYGQPPSDDTQPFRSIFDHHLNNGKGLMLNCNWIDADQFQFYVQNLDLGLEE